MFQLLTANLIQKIICCQHFNFGKINLLQQAEVIIIGNDIDCARSDYTIHKFIVIGVSVDKSPTKYEISI